MMCLFFCANVCSSDIYQLCKLAYFDNWRSQKPLIHIKPNWADMAYYWSLSKLCVTNRPPSKITVVTAINYGLRYIQREKSEKKKFWIFPVYGTQTVEEWSMIPYSKCWFRIIFSEYSNLALKHLPVFFCWFWLN